MRTLRVRLAVCSLLLALTAAVPGAAAQDTGTVQGTVYDAVDQLLPGATVTLIEEATGQQRTAVTDERGQFAFRAVSPGSYTVRVELSGFRAFEQHNNVLNASGQLGLDHITMAVGAISEVLRVVAQGATIETTNSDHSSLLTAKQLSEIQTQGRDVMSLLRLMPGVRYEADITAMGDSFGSTVPNIAGMRRAWNQITVDGLNGNELSGTNRFSSAINLDAIAEVKVLLNTYKAEFGRSGGANIEIVTKSGSTDYRGSAYWYGRRDKWNANSWEANRAGLPKAKLHIDTYGFNLGGPVRIPKLLEQRDEKKLFFFYSLEAPQVQRPGPPRLFRMPTELERQGNFSQTLDTAGRPVTIRDPTTGAPFANNIIPADRLQPDMQRLMNLLPLPNRPGESVQYNFVRQETSENPRWNHLVRIDSRTSPSNTIWGTLRTFNSNQYGSEITAAPARWGFFDAAYIFSDSSVNGGWNRIFGPTLVNELQAGVKWQTEGFQTKNDSDWTRIRRSDVGWTFGQFNPQLNTQGVIPRIVFGLNPAAPDPSDFTFDNRLGQTAKDALYSIRNKLTWTRGTHTFKAGGYLEYLRNQEARGGNWMGEFNFSHQTTNPLSTGFAFSNALLGVFNAYTETDRYRETRNRAWMSEFWAQDTWAVGSRVTLDYGVRFLWYTPYYRDDDRVANFDPSRFDPTKVVRLYQPAMVGGARRAVDPVTGEVRDVTFIGAIVPGSGDETNGMVLAGQDGTPRGLRETLAPQIEPRFGIAWDLTGSGKTVLHASAGVFHNSRLGGGSLGNVAGNPPFIHNPIFSNGTMATLLSGTATAPRAPATVEALEPEYKTPTAYNWSVGVRRDVGWGTAVDATYAGSTGRNMEMYYDLNPVPDGARYLDLHPENRDPTNNAVLPAQFLRPYRGYQNIRVRGNSASSDYHSLQLQVNRRYIKGIQFGTAYTYQRARGYADEDPGNLSLAINRPLDYFYSELAQSLRHMLVINYTWEVPHGSGVMNHAIGRALLDGWQISGENSFISGEWAPVTFTTTDNFDFTGGEGGQATDLGGGFRSVRPNVVGDPNDGPRDPLTGWFDTAAFQRPSGRGDFGNAPRNVVQRPGFTNWNLAFYKNFAAGGRRAFQIRAEVYNVLNNVQFVDVDRAAVFDATGRQTKATFGTAIGISAPTRPPRTSQLSVRFNF